MGILAAAIVLTCATQQAPRDPGAVANAPRGTAVIRGRIVAPGTKTPVPGAMATLGGSPTSPRRSQSVYSDASGRFEFKDLPAGTYGLSGSPSFYQKQFLYGPRTEISVVDAQIVEGVELVLGRAGAIVGRLVDEYGQPIGGMGVHPMSATGRPGMGTGISQTSDEFGRFRLFGMTPGAYYVVARGAGFSDPNIPDSQGLIETYYPGTASRADAVRVNVRTGEETDVGDLRMLRGRLLRVRGMVVDSQGRPAQPNRTSVSFSCKGSGMSRGIDPQSRFDFQPGPPGACRLSAIVRAESGQAVEEYVAQAIALIDSDVDVVLATKPAVAVTGRVVIEDQSQLPSGTLSIRVQSPSAFGADFFTEPAPVTKDLTFTFSRLAGEQLLRIQGITGSPLTLKAVLRGDEDVTDIPTEFKPDDAIRVVLAARTSGLQGTVTNDAGKPANSAAVLIFSEDRRTWVQWSTRVQGDIRTSREGHYMGHVPPGRYYAIAVPVERSMPFNQIDPVTLDALVKEATTVVVSPDEIRVVDLRLSGGGGN